MTKPHSVGMQLSFALYGAANRMARMHKPFLEPLGLTFPQYLVMLELLNGSPLSVGTLGTRLDMDTGTITPLIKRLEAAGFVTRTRDPDDERRVLVDLTPRVEGIRDEIWNIGQKIKSACKLDEQGLIDLRDTLTDLSRPRQE
ncbi:MarR family winged helix-turn-helix transcriptional regulator [Agrobacterium fabrum]|uniref:MarR family winged helix-turn-helix transcriptional regulator n=1 Tax=Agrobacterium fabrum TaxID=1176649 RepID=UPI001571FE4B|nr:MarR family transcriptional regulator [Agrobacterium fabrum]WCK80176.1 MarR family transcriptional regulator [Agrobacterium fabrum]